MVLFCFVFKSSDEGSDIVVTPVVSSGGFQKALSERLFMQNVKWTHPWDVHFLKLQVNKSYILCVVFLKMIYPYF